MRKGLKGLRAGKRQVRTPLKTDGWSMWLRELLPVALERPAEGFEKGLREGKRQARTPLKTDGWGMWLRELLPVALERHEGGQTAGSNWACGRESYCRLRWKGLRKGLRGLKEGKRQVRTPLKTDGWGMWLRELLPVALERPAEGFEGFEGGQTAGSNTLKKRRLGHVAARVVASCLGNEARMPLKTDGWGMWLRELLPVALERPAEGFERFEGGQTAGSNALKNR